MNFCSQIKPLIITYLTLRIAFQNLPTREFFFRKSIKNSPTFTAKSAFSTFVVQTAFRSILLSRRISDYACRVRPVECKAAAAIAVDHPEGINVEIAERAIRSFHGATKRRRGVRPGAALEIFDWGSKVRGSGDGCPLVGSRGKAPRLGDKSPRI